MSAAKAISLIGSLIYLLIFIAAWFFPDQIKQFISQSSHFTSKTIVAVIIASAFLLTIVNLCYFYYLSIKSKKGEEVSSAAFLSLQLIILPIMVLAGFLVVFVF